MLFNNFKKYKLGIENASIKSMGQYEETLNRFYNFFGGNIEDDEFIKKINVDNVKSFIEYLANNKKEPTTRNKYLSVIKSFYKYLYSEENINIDTKIFLIKKAKTNYKEPLWLQDNEVKDFINSIKNVRSKAMVSMLYYTGIRYSELANITMLDFLNGKAIITGKGNKQRFIYFDNKDLKENVADYILTKRAKIVKQTNNDCGLLFINNNGKKVIAQNFIRTLKKCAKDYGKLNRGSEMSPHKLRHSFITNALLNGEPIAVVRDAVGHSNISITNNYAHSTQNSIKNLMNQNKKGGILEDEREMFRLD